MARREPRNVSEVDHAVAVLAPSLRELGSSLVFVGRVALLAIRRLLALVAVLAQSECSFGDDANTSVNAGRGWEQTVHTLAHLLLWCVGLLLQCIPGSRFYLKERHGCV